MSAVQDAQLMQYPGIYVFHKLILCFKQIYLFLVPFNYRAHQISDCAGHHHGTVDVAAEHQKERKFDSAADIKTRKVGLANSYYYPRTTV